MEKWKNGKKEKKGEMGGKNEEKGEKKLNKIYHFIS